MNAQELQEKINNGETNCSRIHLENEDGRNIPLRQINLEGAKFINCNLAGVSLSRNNLSNIDFSGSDLSGANLEESNLTNAIVNGTNLDSVELIGANLTGVDLSKAINVATPHILFVDEFNNPKAEFVRQLRKLTFGLHNIYNTEGSAPYSIFLWDVELRGEFTLSRFLETTGLFVEIELDAVFLVDNPVREYEFVIERLNSYLYLADYKFYLLKTDKDQFERGLLFFIGKTIYGDWIGISTRPDMYNSQHRGFPVSQFKIPDNTSGKSENKVLKHLLNKLAIEIDIEDKCDNYLDCFVWEIAETRDTLIHNILVDSHAMGFTDLEPGFFGENIDNEWDWIPDRFDDMKQLAHLLRSNLKDIKVYRFNDGLIDIYIVGKDDLGNSIIIHNQLTQT